MRHDGVELPEVASGRAVLRLVAAAEDAERADRLARPRRRRHRTRLVGRVARGHGRRRAVRARGRRGSRSRHGACAGRPRRPTSCSSRGSAARRSRCSGTTMRRSWRVRAARSRGRPGRLRPAHGAAGSVRGSGAAWRSGSARARRSRRRAAFPRERATPCRARRARPRRRPHDENALEHEPGFVVLAVDVQRRDRPGLARPVLDHQSVRVDERGDAVARRDAAPAAPVALPPLLGGRAEPLPAAVPLIWRSMPDLQPSSDRFARGLKARVEGASSA